MTILTRLEHWKEQGAISPEQHAHLASLSRQEPFSVFLELSVLLYAGVLAFVAGLGWTVTKVRDGIEFAKGPGLKPLCCRSLTAG